jgi:hypothetical protein
MKKIVSSLLLTLAVCTSLYAQYENKMMQGKVVFDISYPNSKLDQQTLAMLPSESVMYFKGQMSRVEVNTPMGTNVVISDHKLGEGTMLMDMMGNKMAIAMNKADIQAERSSQPKPVVKQSNDTKVIAGHTCKKATVTQEGADGKVSFDVWYTDDLLANNSFASSFDGIDGFMLEFETIQNGMSMKMIARSIEEMTIDDEKFMIPTGYQRTTWQEMKNNMKGGK